MTSNNMILSQLKNILNKNYSDTAKYIQAFLQPEFNINCSISSTPCTELKCPSLIGCTALHLAFMETCIEGFRMLLENNADYTIKNRHGLTVLHQIVEDFNKNNSLLGLDSEFATLVMSAHTKNPSNPCTSYGLSHFHAACLYNNAELVKLFLVKGESVNHSVNSDSEVFPGYSPLHFAVRSIYGLETAEILIEFGADVHAKNTEGKTPLVMLIEQKIELYNWNKDYGMVTLDLLHEAQQKRILNLLYRFNNNSCESLSPFHVACIMNDSSMLENMFKSNVDIDQTIAQDSPFWPGFTGLHFAAICNVENFLFLLKRGADVKIKNASGQTAFEMLTKNCSSVSMHKVLSSVKIWKDIVLSDNKTTLLEAIDAMENAEKLKAFFESSSKRKSAFVPIDSPLWPGFTILHIIVQLFNTNSKEILRTCLEAGANILAQCANGSTALHLAFLQQKTEVLDVLCQYYLELPDVTNDENLSHLHIACATPGQSDLVTFLLQREIDVNKDYRGKPIGSFLRTGFTPLHIAVVRGDCEMVKALLEQNADRYAADSDGFTPIHWVLGSPNPDKIGLELLTLTDVREIIVSGLSHIHVASYIKGSRGDEIFRSTDFIKKLLAEFVTSVNGIVRYNDEFPSFLKKIAGLTPLSLAVQKKNWMVARLLVKSGADILAEQPNGSTPFYDAVNLPECFDEVSFFNKILKDNDEVRRRVTEDTGLTMLHLTCCETDVKEIERLLENGESWNLQICLDSPIWPGYTALHIIVRYGLDFSFLRKLRLDYDTTLQNADGDTCLHLAYKHQRKIWLRSLLRNHLNYDENPANKEGLSHFHIACSVKSFDDVNAYLQRPVDVNAPVDPFSELSIAGQSALHLALNAENYLGASNDADRCSRTVDLLLENGALVNAKDSLGETPLHKAVKLGKDYDDVFQKIVEAGANVNATDIFGVTPLESLLTRGGFSAEELKVFISQGCRFNMYNSMEETGYVSAVFINHGSESEEKRLLFNMMLEHPRTSDTDERDRTIIHSLVANSCTLLTADDYADIISQLLTIAGCDIDDQDNLGYTALHEAAYHQNERAVEGLLIAGADINIMDNDGDLAIAHISEDAADEKFIAIALHVRKLEILGLYASQENKDFAVNVFQRFNRNDARLKEVLQREVELAKSVEIISHSLTLYDFLSEFSTKATFATARNRIRVERFFRDFKDKRFVELRSLFKLQYRKAVARPALMEQASLALKLLSGCPMEGVEFIVKFLNNNEMKNLIKAAQINDALG